MLLVLYLTHANIARQQTVELKAKYLLSTFWSLKCRGIEASIENKWVFSEVKVKGRK